MPSFLQRLFEQERERRKSTLASTAKQACQTNTQSDCSSSLSDGHIVNHATPARAAHVQSCRPASFSGSATATSELASFPMDGIDVSRGSYSSTSSTPILAADQSVECVDMPGVRQARATQQQFSIPIYPNLYQTQLHQHHMHHRPNSTYDYASSTSSMTTDDTSTIASEVSSLASRSTSPAARSVSAFPASGGNNVPHTASYSYTSPATSPFFQHSHLVNLNGHGHGYGGFAHLQPLKLPPPSLDLPKAESAHPASMSISSCEELHHGSGKAVAHAMPVQKLPLHPRTDSNTSTSPLALSAASSVASTSTGHASAFGGHSNAMHHFSPSPNSPRSFQQYSPLHPFHQQGFMSPSRGRSLHTPLATLGPDPTQSVVNGLLTPPDNFAPVYPGIYRSSFPSSKNFEFLKTLKLKTVLTLVQEEEYPRENREFFKANKIQFIQIGIPGNKEPFVTIPDDKIRRALSVVLDKRNHPLLIHCNKGKHRTGCLVGCLRKMQCWSSTAIFEEYRRFSFPKSRAMDQLFIELFQPDWSCVELAHLPAWCEGEDGGLQGRTLSSIPSAATLSLPSPPS